MIDTWLNWRRTGIPREIAFMSNHVWAQLEKVAIGFKIIKIIL